MGFATVFAAVFLVLALADVSANQRAAAAGESQMPGMQLAIEDQLISAQARDADLRQLLFATAARAVRELRVHGGEGRRVSVSFEHLPFARALVQILQAASSDHILILDSDASAHVFILSDSELATLDGPGDHATQQAGIGIPRPTDASEAEAFLDFLEALVQHESTQPLAQSQQESMELVLEEATQRLLDRYGNDGGWDDARPRR